MEAAQPSMRPQDYDVLISDMDENDLRTRVAGLLSVSYLSDTVTEPSWPVTGILFGAHKRTCVNLIVQWKEAQPKNVIFLVRSAAYLAFVIIARQCDLCAFVEHVMGFADMFRVVRVLPRRSGRHRLALYILVHVRTSWLRHRQRA